MNNLIYEGTSKDLQALELVHFSENPLRVIQSRSQLNGHQMKPNGLWVSIENEEYSWSWWCKSEEYSIENLTNQAKILLSDKAKIFWLKTYEDIKEFAKNYSNTITHDFSLDVINWNKVARDADGIIISPYLWDATLAPETFWYYPWDCASGCIWNAEVISLKAPILL